MEFAAGYLEQLHGNVAEIHKLLHDLPAEALDWAPSDEGNSIAVLAAHLAGSIKYWLGDVLANRESRRDRDAEFVTRGVDAVELATRLEAAVTDVEPIVAALTFDDLAKNRFSPRNGREYSVAWVLNHALEHCALHVGHAQVTGQVWMLNHPR